MTQAIAALPFHEQPAFTLLALDREGADPDFEGYGWARLDQLWLAGEHGFPRRLDDVLVIAVHAADDAPGQADDVVLDFAVDGALKRVPATAFLREWLPKLPKASTIVLAMCNRARATLACPPGTTASIYYASGNVVAWLDPCDRIRLTAETWRTLRDVTTEFTRRPGAAITDDEKQTYVGLYLLKKLDLRPEDGGMSLPVVLPSELSPLDDVLQQLAVEGHVVINPKKARWDLTKQGIAYLGEHIDEAADLIDEFDDKELADVLAELRARNLDLFRARYLWGWYDGEFDDLVLYQERRGVRPVERMWAFYLMSDEFWNDVARDLSL
ncbi:MAG TPA: hypothetical protein VHN14_14700 [Kofleriaceae bacterium]|nr:hypothetical protein [Kofleriaceae bacterium]